jgi:hypothetical protein
MSNEKLQREFMERNLLNLDFTQNMAKANLEAVFLTSLAMSRGHLDFTPEDIKAAKEIAKTLMEE